MKRLQQMKLPAVILFLAMVTLAFTNPGQILASEPELINPGFEEGDLSGWATEIPSGGAIDVVSEFIGVDGDDISLTYKAKEGTHFALLKSNEEAGNYTVLAQTIEVIAAEVLAGTTISGWAFFKTTDLIVTDQECIGEVNPKNGKCDEWGPLFDKFNDYAQVWIENDETHETVVLFDSDVKTVGDLGNGAWTVWYYTFPEAGTYILRAGVANDTWPYDDSYLGLDLPVPTTVSPQGLKQSAIVALSPHEGESKRITKAIKEIWKSLDDKLWVEDDEYHLDPKHGKKAFHHEHKAVKELMKLQERPHHRGKKKEVISDAAAEAVEAAIVNLVSADQMLASTVLEETYDLADEKKVVHERDKAEKEFAKGNKDFGDGKFDKAIHRYQKAWHHAQKALHHAQNPRHHHKRH
jgi:hypothetical protein